MEKIIELITNSPYQPEGLVQAVNMIQQSHELHGVRLSLRDRQSGTRHIDVQSGFHPDRCDEYIRDWSEQDIRQKKLRHNKEAIFVDVDASLSDIEKERNSGVNAFLERWNVGQMVAAHLNFGANSGEIWIERGVCDESYFDSEVRTLNKYLPYIKRSLIINRSLQDLSLDENKFDQLGQDSEKSILLIHRTGKILEANAVARELFQIGALQSQNKLVFRSQLANKRYGLVLNSMYRKNLVDGNWSDRFGYTHSSELQFIVRVVPYVGENLSIKKFGPGCHIVIMQPIKTRAKETRIDFDVAK